MEHFITNIQVNYSRGVTDFAIPLSKEKRQHLIITGKNGSGKTSLLLELNKFFKNIITGNIDNYYFFKKFIKGEETKLLEENDSEKILVEKNSINRYKVMIKEFGGTELAFSSNYREVSNQYETGKFLLAYFGAKRNSNLKLPSGISKLNQKSKYDLEDKAHLNFLQYLVNLKAERSFAKDDNETHTVNQIDNWFKRLEDRLKYIFDAQELELKFDRKNYNFDIIINQSETFNFTNLSDGYSAIINIVSELILRMEAQETKAYDLEGVVLIDEIETHLHVDLQKKILPFLIDFFPKIQFIVTTHSPFVLSSVSNATICDLETRIVTTDLSNYSYDAIIESYFQSDKYSDEVKQKVSEFEVLMDKSSPTENEREKLITLRNYFAHTPKHLAPELMVKLQSIELKALTKQKSR